MGEVGVNLIVAFVGGGTRQFQSAMADSGAFDGGEVWERGSGWKTGSTHSTVILQVVWQSSTGVRREIIKFQWATTRR